MDNKNNPYFNMKTRKEVLEKLKKLNKSYKEWKNCPGITEYLLEEVNLLNWVLGYPERKE
jgi:hypothetical protein